MDTPFFSIIVPVYNVEKYITKCIKSIISQSFSDFEIIVVDDESPDQSISILKEKFNDKRIKIYTKKNGGLSDARNFGLEKANGIYVWFIDSDDFIIDFEALEKIKQLISVNNNPEIITFNIKVIFENQNRENFIISNAPKNSASLSGFDYIKKFEIFPFNAWTQCYRKDFLIDNKFLFPLNFYYEDILLNIDIYKKAKTIVGLNEVCYGYYRRDNSITSMNINENHMTSQITVIKKVYNIYNENNSAKNYFKERLQIEYERTKAHYRKNFSNINYSILKKIKIPIQSNDSFSQKFEKKLFYYFPFMVLNNLIFFRKMNTLERIIFNKKK